MILDAAPPDYEGIAPLDIEAWPIILVDRTLPDGRHVVLGDRDGPHHLWLRATPRDQPLAYVIVRDAAIELRRRLAWRLDRRLAGAPPSRTHGAFRPAPFQRRRLNLLLDILDLSLTAPERPTSHEIARRLVYPGMTIGRGMDWKSSTERRRTQRLIGEAFALMRGGYRQLLLGHAGATKAAARK